MYDKQNKKKRIIKVAALTPTTKMATQKWTHHIQQNWVINLSNTALTEAQETLLVNEPNITVSSRNPCHLEYIMTIEQVCPKPNYQYVEELRSDISGVVKRFSSTKP